ncbi:GNAT family N-acetyltransferase [Kocuria coralli]|uniref:GNAT family N-acetyltransferase n=1 Tax=Kocuria coralli TaxID=1461025 RepID=A0A5J5KXH9_9MICC|nr:GNAT family N-acetyltransferase [Kocuria coralli]KAA9394364.1 GNAT family N-acetyltransferase [Kocuria coralli]
MNENLQEYPEAREVRTDRLLMRPFTTAEIEAVVDGVSLEHFANGFPIPESVDQLKDIARSGGFFFMETMYSPLACVEIDTGLVIGSTGFAAAPIDGALEIVGFLAPSRRRRGYASEGLQPLVDLAFENPEVTVVRASVPQDNAHIEALLGDAGFERTDTVGPESEYRRFRS